MVEQELAGCLCWERWTFKTESQSSPWVTSHHQPPGLGRVSTERQELVKTVLVSETRHQVLPEQHRVRSSQWLSVLTVRGSPHPAPLWGQPAVLDYQCEQRHCLAFSSRLPKGPHVQNNRQLSFVIIFFILLFNLKFYLVLFFVIFLLYIFPTVLFHFLPFLLCLCL